MTRRPARSQTRRGQALVEFAVALPIIVFLLMALFDFGRGIYTFNGVSQAAREIARVTSVHPGSDFTIAGGRSAETTAVVNTQRGLVPGLTVESMACVDIDDSTHAGTCTPGFRVKVTVTASYEPVSLLGFLPDFTLRSASSVQIQ